MFNVVLENTTLQLYYNLIHWLLGVCLILATFLEYKTQGPNTRSTSSPLLFALSGLVFVVYVTFGYSHYYQRLYWPWQLDSEHTVHVIIGAAWFMGGLLTFLARTGFRKTWLQYAMPVSLVFGGLKFLLPHQHSATPGATVYLTTYHYILGSFLIASGVFMFALFATKRRIGWLSVANLIILTMTGLVFLAYRHPLQVSSACTIPGPSRQIDISKQSKLPLRVNLCDRIIIMATSSGIYQPALGPHSHHIHYPGFEETAVTKSKPYSFTAFDAGSFPLHDHDNNKFIATLLISKRPSNESYLINHY